MIIKTLYKNLGVFALYHLSQVALTCLGVSTAAPIFTQILPYSNLHGGALLSSPLTYNQHLAAVPSVATYNQQVAAVPSVATYNQHVAAVPSVATYNQHVAAVPSVATYGHPNVAAVQPYHAPALRVAHVPVAKHVGYKVTLSKYTGCPIKRGNKENMPKIQNFLIFF